MTLPPSPQDNLKKTYIQRVLEKINGVGQTQPFFLAFLSYVTLFTIARGFTVIFPIVQIRFGEFHIHHYYFGVLALIIAGGIPAYTRNLRQLPLISLLYGGGLGLIANQIGEMFTGDYWSSLTWILALVFGVLLLGIATVHQRKTLTIPRQLEDSSIVQKTSKFIGKISSPTYLLVLLSFFVSFLIARVYVIVFPTSQFWVSEIHIHHYNLGIVFLLLATGSLMMFKKYVYEKTFLISYGTGIGVFMDEIGLQLDPLDRYWTVISYFYIGVSLIILTLILAIQLQSNKRSRFFEKS